MAVGSRKGPRARLLRGTIRPEMGQPETADRRPPGGPKKDHDGDQVRDVRREEKRSCRAIEARQLYPGSAQPPDFTRT